MQELPLIRLTFPEFRAVLERWQCRCTCLATFGEMHDVDGVHTPALYVFERDQHQAILHIWDDTWPVPMNDIRSVCAALGLDLSIFDTLQ